MTVNPNLEYNKENFISDEQLRKSTRLHVLAGAKRVGGLPGTEDAEVLASLVHALQVQIDYLTFDVEKLKEDTND